MSKKIISLFTLTAFVVFTFSCYSIQKKTIKTITSWKEKGKEVKIVAVLKKSGERIEFPEGEPGKIVGEKIVGEVVDEAMGRKPVSIPVPDVWVVWVKKADAGKTVSAALTGAILTVAGVATLVIIILAIHFSTIYKYK
jgi:hypothetical protein